MSQLIVGVNLDLSTDHDPAVLASTAEQAGFDLVSCSDHPCGASSSYESWTTLAWVAARTTRIGIASRVLATPMRLPAMIAKSAETLDRLSAGRLVLGLGSGHSDAEFAAFGLGTPTPREKVDGLRDAIMIARRLWAGGAQSYDGRRHHIAEAQIAPAAARSIPIWLGTYGPRALAVTGELADGWIPSLGFADVPELTRMLAVIADHAERSGRPRGAVNPVLNVVVDLDPSGEPTGDRLAGPPERVRDDLLTFRDLGFVGFNLMPVGDPAVAMERLGAELLPLLRAG